MLFGIIDKDLQSNRTHILSEDMGPFFRLNIYFCSALLITTTEESTRTIPVSFSIVTAS